MLATAGLKRLGLAGAYHLSAVSVEDFPPAVSQGAIGVCVRADDAHARRWVAALWMTVPARLATTAERALLASIEAGCQVPLGALATLDGEELHLRVSACARSTARRMLTAAGRTRRAAEARRAARGTRWRSELLAKGAQRAHRQRCATWRCGGRAVTSEVTPARRWSSRAPRRHDGPLSTQLRSLGLEVLLWPAVRVLAPRGILARAGARAYRGFQLDRFCQPQCGDGRDQPVAATCLPACAWLRSGGPRHRYCRGAAFVWIFVPRRPMRRARRRLCAEGCAGARILYPASSRALPTITQGLTQLGAASGSGRGLSYRGGGASMPSDCRAWIDREAIGAVTFASPSAVIELERALGSDALRAPPRAGGGGRHRSDHGACARRARPHRRACRVGNVGRACQHDSTTCCKRGHSMGYPLHRPRRLRQSEVWRRMVRETRLTR